VVHQPEPVTRDEAAAARVLPRTTAAFHLDRLVEKDLLDTPVPGSTPCQALPALALTRGRITTQRRYDLARSLLSGPSEHAERFGGSPRAILGTRAYQLGNQLDETARSTVGDHDTHDTALRILEKYGFELRIDGNDGSPIAPSTPWRRRTPKSCAA
jgi:predicted ArsR family transcriptional regulator